MNEQVDNQIVSLQFDNKNFEKNTKTSMKTLDKLKEKLNFKGAAKGLQDIEDASRRVKFETLANSIDTVKNKFSALEIMGVTALANLTNSAVNYGKRIVSALTIDPVNTGFSEYETKMGSIQTILANTSSKGKKLEDVTKVLNELNTYADKTIYNFAEMTRNIGTFTAAGVDLEVAASAIQGIANIAAVSGSTSQQASVAMYQLSQAISSGTVRLQDWNSVVNAGMGGEKFQNALIATAREMARTTSTYAYNVDELLIKNGSFRESLREGWLTADVLNQTLKKFTVEGAKEYGQKMMDLGEWTQETADSLVAMAQEMEDAATKVKTFSQLWDTLKEAAQSGWAQTWEIIIGDFDQAKTFLTYISDTVSGMIGRSADKRNTFLGIALNPVSTFNSLIQNAGLNLNYFQEKIKETAKKNEIAIDSLIKEHGSLSNVISEGILPTNIFVEALESLTEEELRSAGYTKDQIEAIQQLGVEAKKTGTSLNNTITAMGQKSGWTLMFDSIKKIVNYISEALSHVKKAWSDTFSPMQSSALYSFVKRINDFASGLSITDETANKLYRTAKGIAAIFDIIFSTVKGGWRLMSRFVSEILGVADVDLLELTARIGDLIVKFRDWLKSVINLKGILDKLSPIIRRLGQFIKQAGQIIANFLDTLRNSDNVPRDIILGLVNGLKDGIPLIVRSVIGLGKTILLTLKDVLGIHSPSTEMFAIGKWIILGLFNGLKEFAKLIWSYLVKFAGGFKVGFSAIIDGAKSVFNGLKPILSSLYNILKTAVNKILSILGELDFNKVMSIGIAGGSLAFMYKIATALVSFGKAAENFSKPLSRLKEVFESISKDIKKLTKAFTTRINIKAVKDLATAIAILAGAIAVLALIPDKDRVDSAIGTILILAGAVAGLSYVATEMAKVEAVYGNGSTLKASGAIAAISASVLMLAGALAKLGSIEPSKLKQATLTLVIMVETLTILMLIVALITKNTHVDEEVHKLGLTLMGVAVALLIFTKVITYVAKASQTANLAAALGLITYMSILLGGIALISTYYSHYSKGMARMLAGFTVDLVLMLGVIKIAASMQTRTLLKGIVAVRLLEVIMIQLIRVSHMYNKDSEGLGGSMLGIGAALLAMAVSVKIISGLDDEALKKGLISIAVFSGIVIGLIAATRLAGDKELKRMMSTLTGMSVCIGMMTIATFALQFLRLPNIAKGITAVSMLAAMVSLMVRSTKGSTNPSKSIYALVVAIGALTASLAILSAIPTGSLFKAVGAISVVLSAFSLLVYSTSKIKENKILGQLWSLTAIVVVLSGLLLAIDRLEVQPSVVTCGLLAGLLATMTGMMIALSYMKKEVSTDTIAKLGILSAVVGALYGLIKLASGMSNAEPAIKTVLGVVILLDAMTGVLFALSYIKDNVSKETIAKLGLMSAVVGALYGMIKLASSVSDTEPAFKTILGLSVLLNAMAVAMAILSHMRGYVSHDTVTNLGIMTWVVGALYIMVKTISGISDTEPAFKTMLGISKLLTAMGYTMLALSYMKQDVSAKTIGKLGLMAVIVGALYGLIKYISYVTHIEPSIKTAFSLSILLTAMAGMMVILSHMKNDVSSNTIKQIGSLSIVVGFLYSIIKIMSGITSAEPTIGTVECLTILLADMVAMLAILGHIKDNVSTDTIAKLGLISVVIGALYGMVKLASGMSNTEPTIETILGLTILLTDMVAMFAVLTHIKDNVSTDTIAKLGLISVVIGALYGMVKLASGMSNVEIPFETFLGLTVLLAGMASVLNTLSKLKRQISSDTIFQLTQLAVIVSLLYGLTKAASVIKGNGPEFDALYGISKLMKALATTLWILSTIRGDIKSSLIVQLGILAGIVTGCFALMKAASRIPSSFSTVSLDNFKGISLLITSAASALVILSTIKDKINASSLVALGIISAVLVGLVYVISLIPNSSELGIDITAATAIGVVLLALCSSVLILAKFPKGSFVTALEAIGIVAVLILALGTVLGALGWLGNKAFGNDLENTLNAGVLIFTKIGEAVGGLVAGGFQAMANVVIDTLNGLAGCLQNFIAALNTINPESMKGFKYLAETILILTAADVLNGIDLFSAQKFQRFGEQIKAFGDPIVEFANTVNENTTKEALEAAKNAASILIVLSAIAPRSGGWIDAIFGSNDLDKFGNQIESFGDAVVRFSNKVAGKVNKDAFDAADEAGKIMVSLQKSIPETGGLIDTICGYSDLTTFGTNIENFGSAIVRFSNKVAGNVSEDAFKDGKRAGELMASLQKSIPDSGGFIGWLNGQRGLGNFGDNIEKFGEGITAFAKSVSETQIDLSQIQTAADAGSIMVDLLNKLPDRQTYSLAGLREGITSAGGLLLQFNNQMNALDVDRTKKAADSIKSLALVVTKLSNLDTSKTNVSLIKEIIGSTVKTLISSADEINRAINEGMEIKPVVKPVLDLSNVRQGASLIPSLLNTQPSLGTLSNVGYISANMNRNSQNGNSDVVAAIDKLRESLGDIGNDTYNINGITYNDDSAIADAIKTIIRAINIERRS